MADIVLENEVLAYSEHLEGEDATKDMFLCFEVAEESFAIEVNEIKEILTICNITPVPETQEYVRGIINLRGDIAPVISVRSRFGKEDIPYDENTCIMMLNLQDMIIGLIIDSVSGCVTIPAEDILPAPNAKLTRANLFVKGIGKTEDGIKLLLDVDKLLFYQG